MQIITYVLECDTCGNPMRVGSADLNADQHGPIEIEIDFAISQLNFECLFCGGVSYLGDLDEIIYHEEGDPEWDEEEEEEEEEYADTPRNAVNPYAQ